MYPDPPTIKVNMPRQPKEQVTEGSNAFKLDKHPVQPKAPTNDIARKTHQLDVAVDKAQIGFGKINILQIANPLKFRIDWNDPESLKEVKFEDQDTLILASGQHRVAALKKMVEAFIKEQTGLNKWIMSYLPQQLSIVTGKLENMGFWSVKLYNQDMIDAGKLGAHLSQNQTLHIYAETQEEKLVLKLQDFHDVYLKEGDEGALKVLVVECNKGTEGNNSTLRKMYTLYLEKHSQLF
ncbi:hypothetical protein BDR05DRAFT_952082 [Suillus weaverae]|nr:hypothetical protein BDR05DRAFT_952082 [Suillus weaverae]